MEGNEIEKAAYWKGVAMEYRDQRDEFKDCLNQQTKELTRALARIEELTTQNLDLIRKHDDLYKIAYGMVVRATGSKDSYLNEEI